MTSDNYWMVQRWWDLINRSRNIRTLWIKIETKTLLYKNTKAKNEINFPFLFPSKIFSCSNSSTYNWWSDNRLHAWMHYNDNLNCLYYFYQIPNCTFYFFKVQISKVKVVKIRFLSLVLNWNQQSWIMFQFTSHA